MDSTQLTPKQARALQEKIVPMLNYLTRLKLRMEETRFPPKDKLYVMVAEAREALHSLSVELHYMGCSSGVGRRPWRPEATENS